jgi:hypothetical protein
MPGWLLSVDTTLQKNGDKTSKSGRPLVYKTAQSLSPKYHQNTGHRRSGTACLACHHSRRGESGESFPVICLGSGGNDTCPQCYGASKYPPFSRPKPLGVVYLSSCAATCVGVDLISLLTPPRQETFDRSFGTSDIPTPYFSQLP